jgi:hypothetical protein
MKEVVMEAGTGTRPFKPAVFASYGNGWRQLWPHFLVLFLIGLIYFVIQFVISLPQVITDFSLGNESTSYGVFAVLWGIVVFGFGIFVGNPMGYGQYYAYARAARGENAEVQDLFAAFKRNYWNTVGASLLVGIIIAAGFFFLIVPGIYLACKLAFVQYLVVDKQLNVGQALGESWRMASHGRAWKVFLLGLLAIPIVIAGLIVVGVGVIISFMWINTALASLYHAIDVARAQPPIDTSPPANP